MRTRRVLAFAAAGTAVAAVAAGATTFPGAIAPGDPTHLDFILDQVPASACGTSKPALVASDTTALRYDTHSLPAAGAATCYTISLSVAQGGRPLYATAYLNSFNPSSLGTNYLGDVGVAGGVPANQTRSFGVVVPAGSSLVVLVDEISPGADTVSYTLDVTGQAVPTAVKLLGFRARVAAAGTVLTWRTADETGAAGFQVVRQANGRESRIGPALVTAKRAGGVGGAGYRLVDRNAPRKAVYRLRLVGLDGTKTWLGFSAVSR